MNLDLLFVADHQATADDGVFAAAGKALAIATRFERSCKALLETPRLLAHRWSIVIPGGDRSALLPPDGGDAARSSGRHLS
jgi:hypothetical protein